MKKPQKSAVDRSSEVIASHSMRPAQEINAMIALREATTQPELEIVQKKLARIQRIAETKELANKVLTSTPGFVKEEAHAQAEWIAQRKLHKQKESAIGNPEHAKSFAPALTEDSEAADLQVECLRCGLLQKWADLQKGDGACHLCRAADPTDDVSGQSSSAEVVSSDLFVECQKCGAAHPWSVLALGDGLCNHCFDEQQESACNLELNVGNSSASSSSSTDPQRAGEVASNPLCEGPRALAIDEQICSDLNLEASMAATEGATGSWRARRRAKAS